MGGSPRSMKELFQDCSRVPCFGCRDWFYQFSAYPETLRGNTPNACTIHNHITTFKQFQKAIRKVRQVQRMRKQRGYAFSQADESQTRVLQAYDTTKHRGRYGEMQSSRPGGR